MLFNSFEFAVFLPLVFVFYWAFQTTGLRTQNALIVAVSYVFYGWWDYRFLGLIVLSSAIDFVVGGRLARTTAPRARKALLSLSLASNLGLLGVFKYYDFFAESFEVLLNSVGLNASVTTLNVVLPVGISFYTFQTLSYTIDVYRKRLPATSDPVAFFAFVAFFPQLVAGPIERASHLLPQFLSRRRFQYSEASEGCRQILGGMVKKVVIADTAAIQVDLIFQNYGSLSSLYLLAGAFLFAIQIYCDFSGYSDIAIGTGRLFGFQLSRNFAFPYFSRDIGEFWRRWHISLSSWFRDYVFIPLGGSRGGANRTIVNLVITFVVSGLWHGANWTFVVWGALNAVYYIPLLKLGLRKETVSETVASGRMFPSGSEWMQMTVTFSLTLVAWVFFRAPTVTDAWQYVTRMFLMKPSVNDIIFLWPLGTGMLWGGALLAAEWFQRDRAHLMDVGRLPYWARRTYYVAAAVIFVFFGQFTEVRFIYFQF